jgi:hypothetical protein
MCFAYFCAAIGGYCPDCALLRTCPHFRPRQRVFQIRFPCDHYLGRNLVYRAPLTVKNNIAFIAPVAPSIGHNTNCYILYPTQYQYTEYEVILTVKNGENGDNVFCVFLRAIRLRSTSNSSSSEIILIGIFCTLNSTNPN